MPENSLSSLKGKTIFTSEGLSIGKVVRFELDPVLWKVRSIVADPAGIEARITAFIAHQFRHP